MVAFFGPWVGEVHVETTDRIIPEAVSDELRRVGADYSNICEPPPPYAVDSVPVVPVCPFDSKEVAVRLGLCLGEQERALAAADLDVDTAETSENA